MISPFDLTNLPAQERALAIPNYVEEHLRGLLREEYGDDTAPDEAVLAMTIEQVYTCDDARPWGLAFNIEAHRRLRALLADLCGPLIRRST